MSTIHTAACILSLSVFALLPGFAGGAERRAVKKTTVPRANAAGSGFWELKPVETKNLTTETEAIRDSVEDSTSTSQGVYEGGAGISNGAVEKKTGQGAGPAPGKNLGGGGSGGGAAPRLNKSPGTSGGGPLPNLGPAPSDMNGPQARKLLQAPNSCDNGYNYIRNFYSRDPAMVAFTADVPGAIVQLYVVIGSVSRGPRLYIADKKGNLVDKRIGSEVAIGQYIFTADGRFSACFAAALKSRGTVQNYFPLKIGEPYLASGSLLQPNGQAGQLLLQIQCGPNPTARAMLACGP